jgi:oligopeptide transport system permease protein
MGRFIAHRALGAVVVLWAIITLSFLLLRFAPGSPFDQDRALPPAVEANKWIAFGLGEAIEAPEAGTITALGQVEVSRDYASGTLVATLTTEAGVAHDLRMPTGGTLVNLSVDLGEVMEPGDPVAVVPKALWSQYLTTLGRYATGDFGVTISSDGQRTVVENLALGLPVSIELGFYALLFSLLFGVTAGLYAGLKQNSWADHAVMSLSMVGISVPTIVSGPVLILLCCYGINGYTKAHWGWELFAYGEWTTWRHKLLPVLTLTLVYTAIFARLTRGGMLEVIRSDYIRTARAKGLDERRVVLRHALKGAILPTVTFLGPAMARLVTGSIVVERIFGIPGLAEYFVTPAINRDYPMVLGVVVLYSALLVTMNLLVDIAYTLLDPRVSYES